MTEKRSFDEVVREFEAAPPPSPWTGSSPEVFVRDFPYLSGVEVSALTADGPHGTIPMRLYRARTPLVGLVWVHGGAFIAGDLDMPEAEWVALELAARGITVLTVDYQKALRGVRHPVPSDEVLAAWRYAADHAESLFRLPPARIHLGGASAGGNLTAGVALRLRDGEGQAPASVISVYPLVHPEVPEASAAAAAAVAGLSPLQRFLPDEVRAINANYTGTSEGLADPRAFAGIGNLAGQVSTYVLVAEADDLRPSGERYAAQLADAGVHVLLEMEPGSAHGHLNEPDLPAAHASVHRLARWLLGHPSTSKK